MTRQNNSLDGFVPRRPGSQLGELHEQPKVETSRFYQPDSPKREAEAPVLRRPNVGIARSDLDESLKGIDDDEPVKGGKKRRAGKKSAPKSKLRRIIKWVVILLVLIVLGVGGWIAYKALHASGNVFKGNILSIFQNQPLKQDANGRSNILVLGTSQDDPGHQGANLTDSIMILSIDQKNKNAYMISIPRDMEVHYGQACASGYSGKINVYYSCVGGDGGNVDADRAALTKTAQFVGGVAGLDIQYGVNVDYTVMRQLVNAVGGSITVDIEGSGGAPGILDQNFDWKCGLGDRKVSHAEQVRRCPPNGHFIDYPNGPATLDAEHALYLAQARGDCVPVGYNQCKATYGLGRSNFDRELNQQKIIKAIRDKAMSGGVLTDIGKVTSLIDALGDNLRTTFETSEIQTLVSLAKDIKDSDIQSVSLIDGDNPIMTGDGQPSAGRYNFTDLQAFLQKKLSSNPVVREGANVAVFNGSGVVGVAQTAAENLKNQGFTVNNVDTAPAGTYANVELYQIGTGMSATKAKLESLYSVKTKTTAPPVTAPGGTNFVVIIGKDPSAKQ